ncbi:LOW QUALITY PROTEIN: gem-associated protein 4-like [Tachyglossus aculeatus]|uniref:LOW QUALITY PROTEIN: gem-associated protein 4-like n=1 Tax=Tachyglossus aculeatus TaxID=9261 RepID=UPI0018F32B6D|nr:LOW QUALITY PROTEIN: gem-associated protein 4-like [Tachyglossus aculeatus]
MEAEAEAGGARGALRGPAPAPGEPGPANVCKETTVLRAGFLLAEKLFSPKALAELKKSDWEQVGQPIIDCFRERTLAVTHSLPARSRSWKKKALIVIWAKVLQPTPITPLDIQARRLEEIFVEGSPIPSVNHAVLFELLKTLEEPELFVELLLALPADAQRAELERFAEHVAEDTSSEDVTFFLDVWREVMRERREQEDNLALQFGSLVESYLSSSDDSMPPPKRFKADPDACLALPLLAMLVEGLNKIQSGITSPELRCYALANLADTLTAFAPTRADSWPLSPVLYLDKMATVINIWNSDRQNRHRQRGLAEKVKEAERDVSLTAVDEPPRENLLVGWGFLNSLLKQWGKELQASLSGSQGLHYGIFWLGDSLGSLNWSLGQFLKSSGLGRAERQVASSLEESIQDFLEKAHSEPRCQGSEEGLRAAVAMAIIEQKMDRHKEMCHLFASERKWAFSGEWIDCLVQNGALFHDPDLVSKLLETTAATVGVTDGKIPESQVEVVTTVILDCYTELSLPDKNKVLSGVLTSWGRQGLSKHLGSYKGGLQKELNRAFTHIKLIVSQKNLAKAISSVARLAVLHPEAALKTLCRLAVFSLGTHKFLAQILGAFPSLRFTEVPDSNPGNSLLVECLKDSVWGKLFSTKEEDQFLAFLGCLMKSLSEPADSTAAPLLSPKEVIGVFVAPYLVANFVQVELSLKILRQVLAASRDACWLESGFSFPLLFTLCQLLDSYTRFWEQTETKRHLSLDSKDLVVHNLETLAGLLLAKDEPSCPETWTKSLSWLQRKVARLDWTVGLRLREIFGGHFKCEVPATLFETCRLPEEEWTSRPLPAYGPGTGLLAWMECCCASAASRQLMLVLLAVSADSPDEVNFFSKGFLVALVQVLPWCSPGEWASLQRVTRSLLERQLLHVPYSLEYVRFMPLLNLKPFAQDLQMSVLFLRSFQFLCSASCASWLPPDGWHHVVRLTGTGLNGLLESVKRRLACPPSPGQEGGLAQEALFVYIQMFCHVLHIMAMLPPGVGDPLFVLVLELLSSYEALSKADGSGSSLLRRANERHFLLSIAENIGPEEQRKTLLQKISNF